MHSGGLELTKLIYFLAGTRITSYTSATPQGRPVTDETERYKNIKHNATKSGRKNTMRPRAEGKDGKTEAQQKHLRGSHSSLWYDYVA